MFEKGRLNTVVGLLTGNLLLGMSYGWWVDKHNKHHANPNDATSTVKRYSSMPSRPECQHSLSTPRRAESMRLAVAGR
jgi:fatty acid desaturase